MRSSFVFREDLSGKRLELRHDSSWVVGPMENGICVSNKEHAFWFMVNEKWAIPKLEFTPDRFIVTQERLAT